MPLGPSDHGLVNVHTRSPLAASLMLLDNDSAYKQVSMPLTLVPDSNFHPCVTWKISAPHAPCHYLAIVWLIQPKTAGRRCSRERNSVRLLGRDRVACARQGFKSPVLPAYICVNRICRLLTLPMVSRCVVFARHSVSRARYPRSPRASVALDTHTDERSQGVRVEPWCV